MHIIMFSILFQAMFSCVTSFTLPTFGRDTWHRRGPPSGLFAHGGEAPCPDVSGDSSATESQQIIQSLTHTQALLAKMTGADAANWAGHMVPYRQELHNEGDAQYTGEVVIGNQSLQAVVDTGSFDLVVFSTLCQLCGDPDKLYDEEKSSTFEPGNISAEQSYGSGTTNSDEAYETVRVGPLTSHHQVFWKVLDAQMPILSEASFQAILGVGPPSSSFKMALDEAQQVRQEIKERTDMGENVSQYRSVAEHYEEVAKHAERSTLFTTNVGMHTFAVCLRPGDGAPGVFIWNDNSVEQIPMVFTEIPVVGDTYWSAELRDVQLGPFLRDPDGQRTPIGCGHGKRCSAVIDTGTSLIVAPSKAVARVNMMLQDWASSGVNCADVSSLPELEFTMGGHFFSLPPETYVGEMRGVMSEEMRGLLPHVHNEDGPSCVALLMTLDAPSQFGPLWVFGLPFFRKYYTAFRFKKNEVDAKKMAFAHATPDCHPTGADPAMLQRGRQANQVERRIGMKIDANKLRVPQWLGNTARLARFGKNHSVQV